MCQFNGRIPEGSKPDTVTFAQDNAETQLIDVMAEKSPISPPTSRSPIVPTATLRMKFQKAHAGSPTLALGESAKPVEVQPAKVELQKDRGIVENLHIYSFMFHQFLFEHITFQYVKQFY